MCTTKLFHTFPVGDTHFLAFNFYDFEGALPEFIKFPVHKHPLLWYEILFSRRTEPGLQRRTHSKFSRNNFHLLPRRFLRRHLHGLIPVIVSVGRESRKGTQYCKRRDGSLGTHGVVEALNCVF